MSRRNKVRNITVPSKKEYEGVLDRYLGTISFENTHLFSFNIELSNFQAVMARLHSSFLSEDDVISIVFSVSLKVAEKYSDRQGLISDGSNVDVYNELRSGLLAYFLSLPRRYTLCIELPSFLFWGEASFSLSENMKLVFKKPTNRLAHLLTQNTILVVPEHFSAYLEISTTGYSDFDADSHAVSIGIEHAKLAIFLLKLHGLCRISRSSGRARATLFCGHENFLQLITLSDTAARRFAFIAQDEKALMVLDPGFTLLGGTQRVASTDAERLSVFTEKMNDVCSFFSNVSRPEYKNIAAAIQWYEDSISSDNQTFCFISACIGLEALLGDSDYKDSVSRRLCDRYAFLMGKDHAHRQQLTQMYEDILELRGELVHGKEARLNGDDLKLLYRVRSMLFEVLKREIYSMARSANG